MNDKREHWEKIYSTRSLEELSWTQARPSPSLEWILESVPDRSQRIIDVGGGRSSLVGMLLSEGYRLPAVMDISSKALERAKQDLGERKGEIEWIEADVTAFRSADKFALWHDRAVFHFLTSISDREAYVSSVRSCVQPGGHLILATFSPQGPAQCSGLDVMRFDEAALTAELGPEFRLIKSKREVHKTPWGKNQDFLYCLFALT